MAMAGDEMEVEDRRKAITLSHLIAGSSGRSRDFRTLLRVRLFTCQESRLSNPLARAA